MGGCQITQNIIFYILLLYLSFNKKAYSLLFIGNVGIPSCGRSSYHMLVLIMHKSDDRLVNIGINNRLNVSIRNLNIM